MPEMTEPQTWTLICVFAAGMFGTTTLISAMFARMMQNGFDGVRKEIHSEFANVRTEFRSEFANVRMEIGTVRTEIKAVHGRIDHLDRDVNAIHRHLFGIDRG